ncbi:unnamed protein product, partial [Amoebophrya sp. A25]
RSGEGFDPEESACFELFHVRAGSSSFLDALGLSEEESQEWFVESRDLQKMIKAYSDNGKMQITAQGGGDVPSRVLSERIRNDMWEHLPQHMATVREKLAEKHDITALRLKSAFACIKERYLNKRAVLLGEQDTIRRSVEDNAASAAIPNLFLSKGVIEVEAKARVASSTSPSKANSTSKAVILPQQKVEQHDQHSKMDRRRAAALRARPERWAAEAVWRAKFGVTNRRVAFVHGLEFVYELLGLASAVVDTLRQARQQPTVDRTGIRMTKKRESWLRDQLKARTTLALYGGDAGAAVSGNALAWSDIALFPLLRQPPHLHTSSSVGKKTTSTALLFDLPIAYESDYA